MELESCMRVILYGGSFDPPHVAHVQLPILAREAINADAVAYIPTGRQPLKIDRNPTPAHHRLAMLRLALADVPKTVIITDEIDQITVHDAGPNYTVDTLETLRRRLGNKIDLRLLIGGDSLRQFDQWRSPQRIVELAQPLVMIRPPDTRESLLDGLPQGYSRRAWADRLVELPPITVSSSQIRDLVAGGQPLTGFVSPGVERYIRDHRLYQGPSHE